MSTITLILLSFSMSVDAFAVTLAKGASCKHPSYSYIIKTALAFGIVEGITPLIGWLIGSATVHYIGAYDHWIAFILLWILGAKMIYEGCQTDAMPIETTENQSKTMNIIPIQPIHSIHHSLNSDAMQCKCTNTDLCPSHSHSGKFNWLIIVTALVTGIDSLVIGVTLAFMEANIILISCAIGLATTIMVVIGIKLGHILGTMIGKRAEIFGGLVLMGIGLTILYDHLLN